MNSLHKWSNVFCRSGILQLRVSVNSILKIFVSGRTDILSNTIYHCHQNFYHWCRLWRLTLIRIMQMFKNIIETLWSEEMVRFSQRSKPLFLEQHQSFAYLFRFHCMGIHDTWYCVQNIEDNIYSMQSKWFTCVKHSIFGNPGVNEPVMGC